MTLFFRTVQFRLQKIELLIIQKVDKSPFVDFFPSNLHLWLVGFPITMFGVCCVGERIPRPVVACLFARRAGERSRALLRGEENPVEEASMLFLVAQDPAVKKQPFFAGKFWRKCRH